MNHFKRNETALIDTCFCPACQAEKRAESQVKWREVWATVALWAFVALCLWGAMVHTANTAPTLQTPVKGEARMFEAERVEGI